MADLKTDRVVLPLLHLCQIPAPQAVPSFPPADTVVQGAGSVTLQVLVSNTSMVIFAESLTQLGKRLSPSFVGLRIRGELYTARSSYTSVPPKSSALGFIN